MFVFRFEKDASVIYGVREKAVNPAYPLAVKLTERRGTHGVYHRAVGVSNPVKTFLHPHGDFQIFGIVRFAEQAQIVKNRFPENGERPGGYGNRVYDTKTFFHENTKIVFVALDMTDKTVGSVDFYGRCNRHGFVVL